MQLLDFIEAVDLSKKAEAERATLICFYHFKETGESSFKMSDLALWMEDFGFSKPNASRLKSNLTSGKGKRFLVSKADKTAIEFVPAILQTLDREYGQLWNDTVTIESDDELLEEAKFCGKEYYLDKLIHQINHCYGHNCYDACAVLMRRLFEVVLVLAYQHLGIEADITKPDGTHKMLEGIVKDAVQNTTLGVPRRISKHFDDFREVGNNSAHSITYTAGKLDIDQIARDYRVMLQDLYTRAGL